MLSRRCWPVVWLLFLGCASFPGPTQDAPTESAGELWQKGQEAMRAGEPARAIGYYEQSLRADPSLTRNHLSLAAAYLEAGQDDPACDHLALYVAAHPEHTLVRTQYAELLVKQKRVGEARDELARVVADEQEKGDESLGVLVHCHSRLLDLAEEQDDDYEAHLHRGIGLYLLARQRAGLDDPEGLLPAEGLLCKAAGELSLSRSLRPHAARPAWYLRGVWVRLGRADAARRCLDEAAELAEFGGLTPAEQRGLALACRARDAERQRP